MKKLIFFFVGLFFSYISVVQAGLPPKAQINFVLSHIDKGTACPAIAKDVSVLADYKYDFARNMGMAHVRQFKNSPFVEALYPMGIKDYYGFISDMLPTAIEVDGGNVTVYRIFMHLYKSGYAKIFFMFGEQGDCVMSSDLVLIENIG